MSQVPSASRVLEPDSSASAPRLRSSPVGAGVRSSWPAGLSSRRKAPLRSRSARTMADTEPCGPSPRKAASASGSRVAPTPSISMRNSAVPPARQVPSAAAKVRRGSMPGIPGPGGPDNPRHGLDAAALRPRGPYFRGARPALGAAAAAALVGALTEPLIPALMQPLLDKGFAGGGLPLWSIPLAIVGLFAIRGLAGFVANYALSWAAFGGVQALRDAMFAQPHGACARRCTRSRPPATSPTPWSTRCSRARPCS
jgi:hypothetical protein